MAVRLLLVLMASALLAVAIAGCSTTEPEPRPEEEPVAKVEVPGPRPEAKPAKPATVRAPRPEASLAVPAAEPAPSSPDEEPAPPPDEDSTPPRTAAKRSPVPERYLCDDETKGERKNPLAEVLASGKPIGSPREVMAGPPQTQPRPAIKREPKPPRPSGEVRFRVRAPDLSADLRERLSRDLETRNKAVEMCYERALRREKPGLRGRAKLMIKVGYRGIVESIKRLPGGTASPEITKCAVMVFRRMRFWGGSEYPDKDYQFEVDVEFIPL